VTGYPGNPPTKGNAYLGSLVTLKPANGAAPKLDHRIVPDPKWPGMYRVRRPDGSLTDMVNLTRAKDALREMTGRQD